MTRLLLACFVALLPTPLFAADVASISVSPSAIEIKHHRHPHAIQVLGTTADGYSVDLRESATFATDNAKVAIVEGGWVKPVGSGSAKITVSAEGKTFTIPVTVALAEKE